jgi:DNA polymerase-3 subunit delta'
MSSWPVYGHDWAVEHLVKSMAHGRVRHAYLITGTPAIGRSRLAHSFALALNCTHPDETMRPCLECRSCKLILSGNHPDILYTETDANTLSLKIEEIRGITQKVALKPYESRYRVAILQDFERARPIAQDALLKTLEEPPPHAVLMVIALSTDAILPTITSRCQTLNLRPVPTETVRSVLIAHYGADEEQAALLARLSGGRMGWAINALGQPDVLDQRTQALDLLEQCLSSNRVERFALAEDLSKDREKAGLQTLLELWQTYWRDVLLLAEGSPVKPSNTDRRVRMEQLLYNINADDALRALRATQTMLGYLSLNVNLRLALEVMFLEYPGLQ